MRPVNIEGQDTSGFYSVLSGLGGEPPTYIPNSHYGEELQYIIDNDQIKRLLNSSRIQIRIIQARDSLIGP
mgnify:CR=1 FL=1